MIVSDMVQNGVSLPLWGFYNMLNEKHTFKLGMDSYFLMFDALKRGNNHIDLDDLYFLCKLLWFKPERHKIEVFEGLFNTYFEVLGEQLKREKAKIKAANEKKEQKNTTESTEEEDKTAVEAEDIKMETLDKSEKSKINTTTQTVEDKIETVFIKPMDQVEIKNTTTDAPIEAMIQTQSFSVSGTYFDLTKRAMQQGWRTMRNFETVNSTKYIDIEKTVARVADIGFLKEVVYKPQIVNRTHLIILIDDSPSMAAFRELAQQLVETAKADKGIKHCDVYYFNNVPERYLFKDEKHHQRLKVADLKIDAKSAIFIISDAGAARGTLNQSRMELTGRFLAPYKYLKLAWLNPIPKIRWTGSSAEHIQDITNMLEVSDFNFKNITKLLKGKIKVTI